ncbi:unnamed protein product [Cylicocyclus nassatus]|uniref:Uncharacterized protein n=1 Tax=Cylicocyclus nassatus TaxID=53992 RepID=A0AA36HEW1_CYLNA|nr:unnamed protein product [Cylicocyclus nassatus]
MNAISLLFLLCVAIAAVSGAIRAKRQRTVIERTVVNRYGGQGFNRQPWGYGPGGFRGGWGQPNPALGFNRGPFGQPPPTTVVRTTVIRG